MLPFQVMYVFFVHFHEFSEKRTLHFTEYCFTYHYITYHYITAYYLQTTSLQIPALRTIILLQELCYLLQTAFQNTSISA